MSIFALLDPRRALRNPDVYRQFQRLVRANASCQRLLEYLAVTSGNRVLDIGCGPADILEYLPRDVEYHGFDLEPKYIEFAQRRYGERGSFEVRLVSPDAVLGLGQFDVVLCIGVLHHLTDEQVRTVFQSALKVLRPGGRIITCDGAYVKGQKFLAHLLLMLDRGRYVRTVEEYLALARPEFPQVKATVLHDLLAIPYTHCIMEGSHPQAAY